MEMTNSQRIGLTRVTAGGEFPASSITNWKSEYAPKGSAPDIMVTVQDSQASEYIITPRGRVITVRGRKA